MRRLTIKIIINRWISTRTYTVNGESKVSIIEDVKNNVNYIFKGELADLWQFIVSSLVYEDILDYVSKHPIKDDLDSFFAELINKDIIKTDKKFERKNNKRYFIEFKNNDISTDYFSLIEKKYIQNNNMVGRLYLNLTYNCNLKCIHCCNPKDNQKDEISFETAKKIIDEALELGLSSLLITGGECSVNKDFIKIAKYAREKYINLEIITNGQKLYDDKKLFNDIVNIFPTVSLSLYSINPEIHDKITGVKGSCIKTMSVIKELRKNDIPVTVKCYISKYNYNCYKAVKDFSKSVNAIFSGTTRFVNNPKNNNIDVKLTEKEIEDFYFENFDLSKVRNADQSACQICSAGICALSVSPNLDITPCLYFDKILGNFKTMSLKDIRLTSCKTFEKNFIVKNLKECFKHEYCKYCVYCPIYTNYDNSYMHASPILCEDARAYYNAFLRCKEMYRKELIRQ